MSDTTVKAVGRNKKIQDVELPTSPAEPAQMRSSSANLVDEIRISPEKFKSLFVFGTVIAAGLVFMHRSGIGHFAWYGGTLAILLLVKLLLALRYKDVKEKASWHSGLGEEAVVGAVMPIHNEDPVAMLACLRSIEAQTRRPDGLYLIDDASTDKRASRVAQEYAEENSSWVAFVPLDSNVGKRHAQGAAFMEGLGQVDIWVTIDSDTVLKRDSIETGLIPFGDPRVQAVSGTVLATNASRGILPKLIDVRYVNSFLGDRAAQSVLGTVLCCCGAFSFWRGSLVDDHLDEWLNQRFLGKPATFGDDRRLTRYALDRGRVVLSSRAIAVTAVPEKFSHYVRQQARWGRSFWRESFLMLLGGSPRSLAWWWTGVEVATTFAFTFAMLAAIILAPFGGGGSRTFGYLVWIAISSLARSVHVFSVQGRGSTAQKFGVLMLSPLYGFMSIGVLMPLRIWSMLTLTEAKWGTRNSVEVEFAKPEVVAAHSAVAR